MKSYNKVSEIVELIKTGQIILGKSSVLIKDNYYENLITGTIIGVYPEAGYIVFAIDINSRIYTAYENDFTYIQTN